MNAFKKIFYASVISLPITICHANDPYAGFEGGLQGGAKYNSAHLVHQNKESSGWTTRIFGGTLWESSYHFRHGVEIGLSQYKTVSNTLHLPQNTQMIHSDVNRKSLDLMAIVDYELDNKINVFAKSGIAYMKQKSQTRSEVFVSDPISAQEANLEVVKSEKYAPIKRNKYVPKAVVGFGYQIAPKQTMDVNYSYAFGKRKAPLFTTSKKHSDVLAVDSLMLAWNYHFS
jgi:opacity protein-like surface antigen